MAEPQPCMDCGMLAERDNGGWHATHPAVARPWECPARPVSPLGELRPGRCLEHRGQAATAGAGESMRRSAHRGLARQLAVLESGVAGLERLLREARERAMALSRDVAEAERRAGNGG